MGEIIAGMASSHAYALADPTAWDRMRERTKASYKRRYGVEPPDHPKVREESLEDRQVRYHRVKSGFNFLKERLREKKPDALILIGDDQNEHFKEDNLPQIALYVGNEFFTTGQPQDVGRQRETRYGCPSELAHALVDGLVEREFDVAFCRSFPNSELISHAHGPILKTIMPEANIPVMPMFINAIHVPGISPRRCYRLGQTIREIIEKRPSGERVILYASGGLSHFTASYPWRHYKGPYTLGCISEKFDRKAVELMTQGNGEKLAQLSSQDLLENGGPEMRNWITLLGAVGKVPARVLAYEPFYSAVMAMGVAYWELKDSKVQ